MHDDIISRGVIQLSANCIQDPVFFKEHLDHVRNQLERTTPAYTVRSVTVLEQTQQTFVQSS